MATILGRPLGRAGQAVLDDAVTDVVVDRRHERRDVLILLAIQVAALAVHLSGVWIARAGGHRGTAETLSMVGLGLAYATALWVLLAPRLTRRLRNTAVLCLGLAPTLMWRDTNPLLFTGFDEQLHMRTLGDIISSHRLFEANPLLEVSPRYPGIEVVTVLLHQTGLPTMASAVIVILLARVLLVTILCAAVEQLTANVRAGGLAVAVYAVSPQFVFFNSQYAYQTMALPLALAAVSLIDRARRAENPLPFFGGATACLFAVAMTHHMTSFLTTLFLIVWTFFQHGPARSRVAYGALAAVTSALAWAIVQRSLLEDYFGPIANDVGGQIRGGARRSAFKDTAGVSTPGLDKLLLLYFAGMLALLVAAIAVATLIRWKRGERHLLQWGPHFLVLAITAAIPVSLAARIVPSGGELFDRSSSFLFLALGFVVAGYWIRLRLPTAARLVVIGMATVMFLGGYVMGSGPSWARLPGSYLVAADTRSMDAEVLAAVKWAGQEIAPGSRIVGDRVSAALLASQAGLWPTMQVGKVDASGLYTNEKWGQSETDTAGLLKMRYLFIDRRLADELPHFGTYFVNAVDANGVKLTESQLSKFDRVPGIKEVYRHGPISIYDLKGLGLPEMKNGWYEPTPQVPWVKQLGVGLILGLLIAGLMRSRKWPAITATAARLRRVWGGALTGAVVLALLTLLSAALLLAHIWLTPLTFGVMALVNLPAIARGLRRLAMAVQPRQLLPAGLVAGAVAAIVGAAAYSAALVNVVGVGSILSDPAALHVATKDGFGTQ